MTKTQIFEEVVDIMKHDASCCKDEPGADSALYREKITDDMDEESFLFAMQSYLATFHLTGHLSFWSESRGALPFRVKRYQGQLYVCETEVNSPLTVGDRVTHVDGIPVVEYAKLHEDMLYGEPEHRQGFAWFKLLPFAMEVTAIKEESGTVVTCPITLDGKWDRGDPYYCKPLRENIAYMRLLDFADDAAIVKMYQENDALLRSREYLIIDVRNNSGGNDSAYLPLLEFCLPEGKDCSALSGSIYDGPGEFNYTERNCESRLKQFEQMLAGELPADTRRIMTEMAEELRANRGKGFVATSDSDDDTALPYIGTALPKKVYIITDENCASSGDAFVDNMRKSDKVTVVGRPTMGILDFSNCTCAEFGAYTLLYPTSRNLYLDKGIRMRGNGVPVDIHIPWTPEHLKRDVDLDTVLELIRKE